MIDTFNYIYIHDLNPIALEFFGIKIYWYSLAYFFGFLLGISYSKFLIKKTNSVFVSEDIDDFVIWAVIGVIVGGRIGYVVFYNFSYYLNNLSEILKIWQGGMSFHGGMVGLVVSMLLFSLNKKKPFFQLANIIASVAPIGIFLGRIANFVNGELWGKKTNANWGVVFDENSMEARHPSQLYEALFEGFILFFILLLILTNKKFKDYNTCSIFLIFYGLFRFFIEIFREPDINLGYIIFNLSMGQILSAPMILVGIVTLKYKKS